MEDFIEAVGGAAPAIVIVALVLIALLIFTKPIRLILKLLLGTVIGFVALILINRFGASLGISLGVNWLNAVVVGLLGIPGVALLLILNWLTLI